MLAAASTVGDDGTIDPKNFATIRTTSIVQRQQKEHLQEEMHDQMSGYKRMRKDHQAALARLEEQCRQEMEKHKQMLDREYEQLLAQFSRELEKLQLKHQEELGKRVREAFAVSVVSTIVFTVRFCRNFTAQEQHQHGKEIDQGSERGSAGREEVLREQDATGIQVKEGEVEAGDGRGGHPQAAEGGRPVAA